MSGIEGTRLGKYEIRSIIGRGAVGVVYEGWDPGLARKVAVKTIPLPDQDEDDQEQHSRFLREARAVANLHHPNIVGVYDYGETEALAYFVMEFVRGRPLSALLEKGARLPAAEAAFIVGGLLAGLQHSHERGVIHRDVKPANILLSAEGVVKIMDFGIAHLESSDMTRIGTIMGTPAYMSPEQVLGEPVDARTDLYSAGVVLYQMLLGRRPFEGSIDSIMHRIVSVPPTLPADQLDFGSFHMGTVLAKALSKQPQDRYGSADEFARALRREFGRTGASSADQGEQAADPTLIMGLGARAAPPSKPGTAASTAVAGGPAPGNARSGRRLGLAALAVAILLGLAGWWASRPSGQSPAASVTQDPPAPTSPGMSPGTADPSDRADAPRSPQLQDATPQPSSVPPARQPEAAALPTALAALNQTAATLPCSLLRAEAGRDGLVLTGPTALGDASRLQVEGVLRRVAAQTAPALPVTGEVQRIDGPYCAVLDLLRLARGGAFDPAPASMLTLAGSAGRLTAGATASVGVAAPAAASILLDYYAADRSVTHLQAGAAVQAPLRAGLITLIVSSAPLLPLPSRPAREPASAYLEALAAGLSQAQGSGARLMFQTLVVGGTPP